MVSINTIRFNRALVPRDTNIQRAKAHIKVRCDFR